MLAHCAPASATAFPQSYSSGQAVPKTADIFPARLPTNFACRWPSKGCGIDRRSSPSRLVAQAGFFEKLFQAGASKEEERAEWKKEILEEIAPLDRGVTANEEEQTFIEEVNHFLGRE